MIIEVDKYKECESVIYLLNPILSQTIIGMKCCRTESFDEQDVYCQRKIVSITIIMNTRK